mmetsp:Transcript_30979/g.57101  ORF Transcript_30979/g.57101 Transcript_30979/m.57101 type:complete len:203 (+) Transcript_30979:2-610(+)
MCLGSIASPFAICDRSVPMNSLFGNTKVNYDSFSEGASLLSCSDSSSSFSCSMVLCLSAKLRTPCATEILRFRAVASVSIKPKPIEGLRIDVAPGCATDSRRPGVISPRFGACNFSPPKDTLRCRASEGPAPSSGTGEGAPSRADCKGKFGRSDRLRSVAIGSVTGWIPALGIDRAALNDVSSSTFVDSATACFGLLASRVK